MESDESAGGAAQRVVPQRVRGCAAVLCFLAVRSCKAPRLRLLGGARSSTAHSLAAHSLAAWRDCRGGIRRARAHALWPFQRGSRPQQGHARPRAMARDIRNHRAIATRVLS